MQQTASTFSILHTINGLIVQADLNFRRWFGVENYAALYGLTQHWGSTNIKMVSEVVGAKFTGRYGRRAVPYFVGGFGVSYATHDFGYGSVFPTQRFAGGVDISAAKMLAFRFEIGIMRFKLNGWETTPNAAGGLVFRSRH
jgi:hypothetical protein